MLARDLVSEPPNVLFPAEMADRCVALEELGVKVEVFGPKELDQARLRHADGRLARQRHRAAHGGDAVERRGGKGGQEGRATVKPLAFIGKGVTFDTGGISIKPAGGMEDMKWDMAGAGAVIGAMAALAGRKAKVDVVGLVGLVENMPSAPRSARATW